MSRARDKFQISHRSAMSIAKVIGDATFAKIQQAKVLLVGAGGIGCELLKDLVLMGYGEIHVVDLDTIDLSNLNRQFLFRHKDIKKPKSTTAVNAVLSFNVHRSKLVPYMANIMDPQLFPMEWFDQFAFVFNALDNIQARSYVNKMCLFLKKPLIESGTTGFNGQVTPIFPYKTECYECTVKETPKTYPVCTIRSTPSQPVHCVTWAKSYLFGQLFGEEEEVVGDLGTDNQTEIRNLQNEQNELKNLRQNVGAEDFYKEVLEKVFIKDINRLLAIEDLWKTRKKPVPLQWSVQSAMSDTDVSAGQEVWPLEKNVYLLIKSIRALQKRENRANLEFDKDDEDTLDFVVAASNIRSWMFHIPIKSKFDIKQIAGNIIPAIATTNAIISGYSALQSVFMFSPDPRSTARMVYTFQDPTRYISTSNLAARNPKCRSCNVPRTTLKINFGSRPKLCELLEKLQHHLGYEHEDFSLILGKDKLIYDIEYDDNKQAELASIGFKPAETLLVVDEEEEKENVEFYVEATEGAMELGPVDVPKKAKKEEQEQPGKEQEEPEIVEEADDLVEIVDEPVSKKHKLDQESEEASKKRRI